MVMGTPSAFGKQLRGTCPEELSLCPGTMGSSGLTLLPLGEAPRKGELPSLWKEPRFLELGHLDPLLLKPRISHQKTVAFMTSASRAREGPRCAARLEGCPLCWAQRVRAGVEERRSA